MSVLASHPCVSPSPSVCLSVDEDINLMQIASTEHNRSANCASFNAQCAPFDPPSPWPCHRANHAAPLPVATVAPSSEQRQTGEARTDIAKCNGTWSLQSGKGLQMRIQFGFITYARRRQWATDGRVATGQSTSTSLSATLTPSPYPQTQVMSGTPICSGPG